MKGKILIGLAVAFMSCSSLPLRTGANEAVTVGEFSDPAEFRKLLFATDAYLEAIEDACQHMRALALRSANGIYTAKDRELINIEFRQMMDEIARIRKSARFRETLLIKPEGMKEAHRHRLVHRDGSVDIDLPDLPLAGIFHGGEAGGSLDVLNPRNALQALGRIDLELENLCRERARMLAACNRLSLILKLERKLTSLKKDG